MICPECKREELTEEDEHWPTCWGCGFTLYDADTLALQAEVKQEQKQAKQIFGRIPPYGDWNEYIHEQDSRRKAQLEQELRDDR